MPEHRLLTTTPSYRAWRRSCWFKRFC